MCTTKWCGITEDYIRSYGLTRRGDGLLKWTGETEALMYLHDLLNCFLETGSSLLTAEHPLIIELSGDNILTHAHYLRLFIKVSKMAEKADPPSSSPPLSPSAKRWSRHEIPLTRREGEEVLALRLRRPPPRKPATISRRLVKRYSCVYIQE